MSVLNGKWIEVFRAGNYGDKGNYMAADIDKMITNFNPAKHEPPAVVGHPENDAPAYGWVEGLKRTGDTLLAKFKDVPDAFEELFRQGRYKKRSVSFYRTADGPVLRHVGFLGAMPPEVKGLADVKFRDGQFEAVDFNEEEKVTPEDMKRGLTEAFSDFKTFVSDLFKNKAAAQGGGEVNIAEQIKTALNPLQAKFTEIETKLDAEKTAREAATASAGTATQSAFAEKQIQRVKDKGRWIPAFDKMGLPQIFAELSKSPSKVSFGEGDKKQEKPVIEVFADFMCALPKIVPVGEIAAANGGRVSGNVVQFNEPANAHTVIDDNSVSMAEAARKMADEKKISYGDALKIVRRSGEYAPNGGAAAGVV